MPRLRLEELLWTRIPNQHDSPWNLRSFISQQGSHAKIAVIEKAVMDDWIIRTRAEGSTIVQGSGFAHQLPHCSFQL
jgi:hypothetical protein